MDWGRLSNILSLGEDGALRSALRRLSAWRAGRKRRVHESGAFTSAFVALAAKMAKADGVAVRAEAEAFERFLDLMPADDANVRRLYELAKKDTAGYELYAERIGRLMRDDPDLKKSVLECLIYVACSDGVLHHAEDAFLHTVAQKFGYTDDEFRHIRAQFVFDPNDPYEVLGVSPAAGDAEIKAHYRKLVTEFHPDKLTARGAQPAMVKAAEAKLATLNTAYEAIVRARRGGGRST